MELTQTELERAFAEVVGRALAEDIGSGDLTSEVLFGADDRCKATHFVGHPLGQSVLGTLESVGRLPVDGQAGFPVLVWPGSYRWQ